MKQQPAVNLFVQHLFIITLVIKKNNLGMKSQTSQLTLLMLTQLDSLKNKNHKYKLTKTQCAVTLLMYADN